LNKQLQNFEQLFKKLFIKVSLIILVSIIVVNLLTIILMETKFDLKSKDLSEIEKLNSTVYKFTNHNNEQEIDHNKLFSGINLIPYTIIDQIITSNVYFFYHTVLNFLKIDGYLCGGHSKYLAKILNYHKIKTFVYNHGTNEKGASHVFVVVEIEDDLFIFDPTFNITYKKFDEYLSFNNLIHSILKNENPAQYIKIINDNKTYHNTTKSYKKHSLKDVVKMFEKYQKIGKKNYMLLDTIGTASPININQFYFQNKYPFLKKLFNL
jgi:hypothetical protein